MYACLAVTCHLHFWQNDRDFLRATVVTRGWNGYRNKSQHRKSTLEKKILPPFQQGFEPATFQSRVRCSKHWAIPAPHIYHHVNVLNIIVITTYNYIILVSHLRCVQGAYNFIFYFRKKKKKEAVSCGILIIIHLHYQCYNDSIIQYINYIRWAGTAIIYILTIPHHSKNSPHAHCISCGMCTNTHRYH